MNDRTGPDWLTPKDALQVLPVHVWPAGVAARRDGVVVLLCGVMRWTRSRARSATAATYPLPAVDGIDLPTGTEPAVCPACVLTRWLRVLAADAAGGRPLIESVLSGSDPRVHDCLDLVPGGWDRRPLLPPVDAHGWLDTCSTLTPRSISTILRQRLTPPPEPPEDPGRADMTARETPLTAGHRDHASLQELDRLLDRLETEADRAMAALSPPGTPT